MTSLAYLQHEPRPERRGRLTGFDRVVLAIVLAAIAVALLLALGTVLADLPKDLPSLIPFDDPAALSNFTA